MLPELRNRGSVSSGGQIMRSVLIAVSIFLLGFYYVNYSSLSEAAEVSRDLCEEAIEKGTIYRNLTDLKTLYPLTQPTYRVLGGKVFQLHVSYHDGRSMVCLEFAIK